MKLAETEFNKAYEEIKKFNIFTREGMLRDARICFQSLSNLDKLTDDDILELYISFKTGFFYRPYEV